MASVVAARSPVLAAPAAGARLGVGSGNGSGGHERSCSLRSSSASSSSSSGAGADSALLGFRGSAICGERWSDLRGGAASPSTAGSKSRSLRVRASASRVPKQFREENLKDGLKQNFLSFPKSLYGLNPTQMDMLMHEDSPMKRQGEAVNEEAIASARHYKQGTGMWNLSDLDGGPSRLSMSVNMYRGIGGYGRPKTAPPDLPSLLLDSRICYLGMPIVPAVTELIVAELLWLDYDNPGKPIYFYVNSSGTQNEKRESIGFETEAYCIADTIKYVKADVYTVNCGQAFGQAAMLLSIGQKGYRAVQPNSVTKLYSPKVSASQGAAIDMWIKAKELDANTDYYVDLLAQGTGKSYTEIAEDIKRPKYFRAQEAIDYGLADKVIESRGVAMERRNYDEMLAQSRASRAQYARPGPQAAPASPR